jgi:putative transposase
MTYNPDIHHRRSIRLKGYDYSRAGLYYITVCTQNRECLFGRIADGKMTLNDAGRMVDEWYHELENKYCGIECHEYIVMPNHIHFIIQTPSKPTAPTNVIPIITDERGQTDETKRVEIGDIVQWLKTMTTNEYIFNVKQNGWTPFPGKLWQRNYYEHIIRDENEYRNIAGYILNNPLNWLKDEYHGC